MEKFSFKPSGVCSQLMEIELDDGKIESLEFAGGCHGNLQGIAALLKGMKVEDVIERLEGICCGNKSTSCPDQIAKALKQYIGE